jgi:polyvinyl alcohol dehydrogenase (cytochrome)
MKESQAVHVDCYRNEPEVLNPYFSNHTQPTLGRKSSRVLLSLFTLMLVVNFGSAHFLMAQDWSGGEGRDGEHAWKVWGGNLHDTHSSSSEKRLNPQNVNQLALKWVFTTGGDVSATPTVEDDAVYVPDWGGNLFRINARTGVAVWSKKVSDYTGIAGSFSRNSPTIAGNKILIGDIASGTLMAIDKETGNLIWKTLVDPLPAARITSSPIVFKNRIYVGMSSHEPEWSLIPGYQLTFRGNISALDLETGAVIWTTYTVPEGYTGGAVWGSNFVVDEKRGTLYAGTGNNYSVPDDVPACVKAATSVRSQLACLDPTDYIDSILSLNLEDGKIRWARRLQGADTFLISCVIVSSGEIPCPDPEGPDSDFGSGPNFFSIARHDHYRYGGHDERVDVVGAGEKSGIYWALSANDGKILWATQVGPGGLFGGIEWGTAVDERRIYVPIDNDGHTPYTLAPSHTVTVNAGSWAALDPQNGAILWQIAATGQDVFTPSLGAAALGPLTVANGVVYAGSMSGDMVAINAKTGAILWKFASGASVNCAPSIVDGTLYWGSGYTQLSRGTGNNKLYAFAIPRE